MITNAQTLGLIARTGTSNTVASYGTTINAFLTTGDIQLENFIAECYVAGTPQATTFQFEYTTPTGITATFSGTSGSLAGAVAGTTVAMQPGALATAPVISSNGAGANTTPWGRMWIPSGSTIKILLGGTIAGNTSQWSFYSLYDAMQNGATLQPLF